MQCDLLWNLNYKIYYGLFNTCFLHNSLCIFIQYYYVFSIILRFRKEKEELINERICPNFWPVLYLLVTWKVFSEHFDRSDADTSLLFVSAVSDARRLCVIRLKDCHLSSLASHVLFTSTGWKESPERRCERGRRPSPSSCRTVTARYVMAGTDTRPEICLALFIAGPCFEL